ncbi:TetR-like C-terminal domain-containing protein [Frankia sp. AgB32]|uniref:TetR-like C-terminal domain-containing protein n=1 Tax=Frankia sp. AgB32 TaxID=631119 RepID=UPI00200E5ACF|nr:TetR-like C-terminal domain-containing protein [Frankia sp. AgB32]MCK9897962.1 TetR/AcrR family transcriptional regulator C-terminal ligand-binding domain-containing protein [Frankia sp. AgB32]
MVTEAIIEGYLQPTPVNPPADTGDIAVDLRTWFHSRIRQLADPSAAALIRAMTIAAADNDDSDRLYALLAEPHRQYLLTRLAAAVQQGQLRGDADPEAAVDAIISAILLYTLHRGDPTIHQRAENLINILLGGMTADETVRPSRPSP